MAPLRFLKIPGQVAALGITKQSGRRRIEPSENVLSMGVDVKLCFGSGMLVVR